MSEEVQNAKNLKAARRAEKVAAKAASQSATGSDPSARPTIPSTGLNTGKKATSKKPEAAAKKGVDAVTSSSVDQSSTANSAKQTPKIERTVGLFSHLEQRKPLRSDNVPKDVHPAILTLALQYSSGQCIGSNTRCVAMLRTFQRVIQDYSTPTNLNISLQRHLPNHLSAQISFLLLARPLSTSMGSAIRALKQEISTTDVGASEEQNKAILISFIDTFIRERIEIAGQVIVKAACERLVNGDVILVYAHSTTVEAILLESAKNTDISVIVVDSRPNYEGRKLVSSLSKANVKCTYVMLSAISYIIDTVTKVIVGAHTVLSNGSVYSRVGTAVIAMVASEYHIPVIVACETYKFSDRVQLDSFVLNELGLTNELGYSLDLLVSQFQQEPIKDQSHGKPSVQSEHNSKSSQLMKLNLMYDVTPDKYITTCISELGCLPTTAIPFAAATTVN